MSFTATAKGVIDMYHGTVDMRGDDGSIHRYDVATLNRENKRQWSAQQWKAWSISNALAADKKNLEEHGHVGGASQSWRADAEVISRLANPPHTHAQAGILPPMDEERRKAGVVKVFETQRAAVFSLISKKIPTSEPDVSAYIETCAQALRLHAVKADLSLKSLVASHMQDATNIRISLEVEQKAREKRDYSPGGVIRNDALMHCTREASFSVKRPTEFRTVMPQDTVTVNGVTHSMADLMTANEKAAYEAGRALRLEEAKDRIAEMSYRVERAPLEVGWLARVDTFVGGTRTFWRPTKRRAERTGETKLLAQVARTEWELGIRTKTSRVVIHRKVKDLGLAATMAYEPTQAERSAEEQAEWDEQFKKAEGS